MRSEIVLRIDYDVDKISDVYPIERKINEVLNEKLQDLKDSGEINAYVGPVILLKEVQPE